MSAVTRRVVFGFGADGGAEIVGIEGFVVFAEAEGEAVLEQERLPNGASGYGDTKQQEVCGGRVDDDAQRGEGGMHGLGPAGVAKDGFLSVDGVGDGDDGGDFGEAGNGPGRELSLDA